MLSVIVFAFASCVDDVVFETKGTGIPVVNCVLKYPAQKQTVTVMTAAAAGSPSSEIPVKDATVVIRDLTDTNFGEVNFSYKQNGEYEGSLSVVPGHKYEIDVRISGGKTIKGQTDIPASQPVGVSYSVVGPVGWNHMMLSYTYDIVHLLGRPFWLYLTEYDKDSKKGQIEGKIGVMDKFLHKFGANEVDEFNISGEYIKYNMPTGDDVPEEVQDGINVLYKRYIRFSGQFDEWRSTTAIYNKTTSILVDCKLDGYEKSYGFSYEPKDVWPAEEPDEETERIVVLVVPSAEYDAFLKELFIYQQKKEDMTDLTLLYAMTDMDSNLSGGAKGIFGAQVTYYLPWTKPL